MKLPGSACDEVSFGQVCNLYGELFKLLGGLRMRESDDTDLQRSDFACNTEATDTNGTNGQGFSDLIFRYPALVRDTVPFCAAASLSSAS